MLLFTSIVLFSGCSKDDGSTDDPVLPEEAKLFISRYFPNNTYKYIDELPVSDNETGTKYEVSLSDGVHIDFAIDGYWIKVESELELPESLINSIPQTGGGDKIREIKTRYSGVSINKIESTVWGHFIGTKNAGDFFVFHGTDEYVLSEVKKSREALPDEMNTFFQTHFPTTEFRYLLKVVDQDQIGYKVITRNRSVLLFDENGVWYNLQGYDNALPRSLYNALPEGSADYLIASYPQTNIYTLVKSGAYYMLRINNTAIGNNKFEIVLDPQTGIIPPPNSEVLAFIRKHFSQSNDLNIYPQQLFYGRFLTYRHEIRLPEKREVLHIGTDIFGKWITVELLYVALNSSYRLPLPESFIAELPVNIGNYLSANHAGKDVTSVSHFEETYILEINNSFFLEFDGEGNFLNEK